MGIFDEIYKQNNWGFGSGHGSLPSVTKGYRAFLEKFIREHGITSVVDYGCGDWQFSRLIDWGPAKYTGLDIVPSVVEENQAAYGNERVSFQVIKPNAKQLPKGDLLIVKDVLQHLSDDMIRDFIKGVLPKFKYALLTNCILPTETLNASIATGEFRPLDLRQAPFHLQAEEVYTFTGPKSFSWQKRQFFPSWKKLVLLVDRQTA